MVEPLFRARVTARTKDNGGRTHPISWGYRPDLKFEVDDKWFYSAILVHDQAPDAPSVSPGETRDLDFHIYYEDAAAKIKPKLSVGSRFTMNEGKHPVADCVVTKIY